ncbi:MAG: HAD-IC family P-type ATPase [Saprospiraceae bacterium]|nr:HAD-IC family P-type ATPase [Saprospiraceae bacterium]
MITKGISDQAAGEILRKSGYNELPSSKPKSVWIVAKEVISEPMFMLLLGCGFLYMVLGDYKEGIVMISTIFILVGISFYQNFRTEKALAALRSLASPRVLVYRDGVLKRIPGREVVPGDVMMLNEGDRVAADGELMESVNLEIDESMLSGESVTVRKQIGKEILVYSGTLIVKGKGTALVMATGLQAKLGKIATSLNETNGGGTHLQKEMTILVRRLGIAGAIICLGIVGIYYAVRGNFIQSLLNGLAAAMAIIPEEFPVVFTIFLALGAWRLSKVNVLTRKPSAIENLGSATVLCSDKTGTITQNKMMVVMLYDGASTIEIDASKKAPGDFKSLVEYAYVASQHDSIDPMEKAIQVLHTASHDGIYPVHPLLKAYELSDDLLAMTRWVNNDDNGGLMGATKGAPEAIFQLCGMSEADAAVHLEAVKKMAEAGCRVIGVARPS